MSNQIRIERRSLLQGLVGVPALWALSGTSAAGQGALPLLAVRRDAGCGCCHVWADIMKASGKLRVTVVEDSDMTAYKKKVGLPLELASCHTAMINGYVVEGHVPVEDILRLVKDRPTGIKGIAVPGMPRGSPGMEMPDGSRDAFRVVAYDAKGAATVYATYAAKS